MMRKRYYILFVARDDDGRVRKIPLPLHYAYGFVAAAVIGAFTIVGMAGSYTRMLLKTESYNQIRAERENLRKNYQQMARIAHDRDIQVASLGALANEVTALYGLRQSRLAARADLSKSTPAASTLPVGDSVSPQYVRATIDEFATLRSQAMSGRISRALESGLDPSFTGDWTVLADAPSLWPVDGPIGSGFGERQDPINGEGAFHTGVDIDAPWGTPVRAAGDGVVMSAARPAVQATAAKSPSTTATTSPPSTAIYLPSPLFPASTSPAAKSSATLAKPAAPPAPTSITRSAFTTSR